MFKRLLAITATIVSISYSTANACNGVLNDATSAVGTHDGFYYNFWKQTAEGNVQINCEDGGNFSASWSNIFNWIGGKGWKPGGPRVVSYSGTFNSAADQDSQNAYLLLYGWAREPFVEYHIIESYGTYNPASGCNNRRAFGAFQSDGVTYDLIQCQRIPQPAVNAPPEPKRYYSVRNPPLPWGEVSGTISVANHFDEWAKHGMDLGIHDFMILAVESYSGNQNSAGSANLTISEGPLESLAPQCGTQGGVPICCSIKADPDRDGMGEENGEVCTVTAATQGTHPDNPSDVLAAINVGGDGNAIERNGIWYEPSTYVTGGQVSSTQDYVSGAHGNAIFQTELSGDLRISIPISNQQVSVKLSFVEFTHTAAGARSFDVTIENQRVLENVDLFAEVGHDTVWRPSPFVVDVTDGTLNINLYGYVDKGTLSSVLVRKSTTSSGGTAGAIDAWFLLIMACSKILIYISMHAVKSMSLCRNGAHFYTLAKSYACANPITVYPNTFQ
jgi:hypothetical protein